MQSRIHHWASGIVCLAAISLAAPAYAAEQNDDHNQIQGTWICIATLQNGREVPNYVGVKGIMKGNKLTWIFPLPGGKQNVQEAVFELDPSQNPKHFTWNLESNETPHRRLYLLSGDTLLMSSPEKGGQPRPENFNAGHYIFVCKRIE